MDMVALFSVLMRFLHISSIAGMVGGVLYARVAALPALNALPESQRSAAASTAQARFKNLLIVLVVLVTVSGLYNGFGPGAPHHSKTWNIVFGIKFLLALHFLSTAVLWAASPYGDVTVGGKQKARLLTLIWTGFIIILMGTYLHYLSGSGL
jgi:uncharacterized membrane protein